MTDQPTFVDNREGNTLTRALTDRINSLFMQMRQPPAVDIATSYFNPEGFFSVQEQLERARSVRLLVGSEPERKDRKMEPGSDRGDSPSWDKIDTALKSLSQDLHRDRDLLGFSLRTDERLRELVDFLRSDRVQVRRFEDGFLHGKAFIFSERQGVIAGSSNFTGPGLNRNLELNLGQYHPNVTHRVEEWFEDLWQVSRSFDLAALYEERFKPYDPYLIYLRVLWERYHEEIAEEQDERDRGIKLTTFQNDGVFRAKRFLHQYNGVVVADAVGLGKTFIAGELIREAVQDRRQRALVIGPAYLVGDDREPGMWLKFQSTLNVHFDALSYAKLRDEQQLGGTRNYLREPKDDYQLVVVDEAHALRNPSTEQSRALRALLQGDPPKDLVLLTATPVNNSLWDLYYLLSYFIKHDATFASEGITSLREQFKEAQARNPADLTPDMLFDVLDATTVRRTRRFVRRHYPHDEIETDDGVITIDFPKVHPSRVDYTFHETFDDEFFADVAAGLAAGPDEEDRLTLARYRPSRYRTKESDERELALAGLLRTGLLKRFESSRKAFANTLERMIKQHRSALDLFDHGLFPESELIDEMMEADDDESMDEVFERAGYESIDSDAVQAQRLRQDLEADLQLLTGWKTRAEETSIGEDAKLGALHDTLASIAERAGENVLLERQKRRNRKVLIFSYFEDTVDWILEYLKEAVQKDERLSCYRDRIAAVAGRGKKNGVSRSEAVWGFAPEASDSPPGTKDEFDILITTDVLAQGVNLQECPNVINYDLPWNPMRVVQRNGRIDRIDSSQYGHHDIYTYIFFPEDRLEDLLELELRVRQKLTRAARAIGLENEIIPDMETLEQNYADRRRQIEALQYENPEMLEQGGTESAAYSGEEYRQELRKGLQDRGEEIEALPWGAGSGFVGSPGGYFFCARVKSEVFVRFLPLAEDMEIEGNTLTCLRYIECDRSTERYLPGCMKKAVYPAWEEAKEDIYRQWEWETDPKNIEPEIRPLFHRVAEHLREYPPDINQDELEEKIESVEAPWGRRYERELREVYESDEHSGEAKSERLIERIAELGLQPFTPPEPKTAIDREEVHLICWLAISPKAGNCVS